MAFLLSDFLEFQVVDETEFTNLRLLFAWIICGILILTVFVNLVFAIVSIGSSEFKYIKNKITRYRKSETKYLNQKPIAENNAS